MLQSFDFAHRTRFVFGPGTIARLGELAKEFGVSRVLVVSDAGVVSAGHFDKGCQALSASGLVVQPFHGFHENPTTTEVGAGLAVAKEFQPELIVGLGGGSSMDCAKGINFLFSCGGEMKDYWGVGKATSELLPMIAVPTTAGTGSEAQSFALISDAETHVKMACGDPRAACKVAILDPELTLTQPHRVTALTAIDAMTHALETYVTKKRNPLSVCYSREAWRLLSSGIPAVLENPNQIEGRAHVQLGACFAGMAIETSMLGAAHALANPLTAKYGTTHGQAVGAMMPHVIRYNGQVYREWYEELWQITPSGTSLPRDQADDAVDSLAQFFTEIVSRCGLETDLSQLRIDQQDVPWLAENAKKQWTGTFNPRELEVEDFTQLYRGAF